MRGLKGHTGLQRAVPAFFPHLQPQSHLLQPRPQKRILAINPMQLLMQGLNLHTLRLVLPLQALRILVEQVDPVLLFVRIHKIY